MRHQSGWQKEIPQSKLFRSLFETFHTRWDGVRRKACGAITAVPEVFFQFNFRGKTLVLNEIFESALEGSDLRAQVRERRGRGGVMISVGHDGRVGLVS